MQGFYNHQIINFGQVRESNSQETNYSTESKKCCDHNFPPALVVEMQKSIQYSWNFYQN